MNFKRVFTVNAEGVTKKVYGDFSYSPSEGDVLGTGTLKVPYNDENYKFWGKGVPNLTIIAGIYDSGKIFGGRTQEVTINDTTIEINLQDYGYRLKGTYEGDFNDIDIREAFKLVIKDAGMTPVLIGIRSEKVSKTEPEETVDTTTTETVDTTGTVPDPLATTTTAAPSSGGTICGTGKTSCGNCSKSHPYSKDYKACYKNYCPACKKSGTLAYARDTVKNPCPNSKFGNEDNPLREGHFFCCNCDADYCVVCGTDHGNYSRKLTPSSGTSTDGTSSSETEETTYEDVLKKLCEGKEYNIYVTANNECVIKAFNIPATRNLKVGLDLIEKGSFSYKKAAYGFSNCVKVQYRNGTIEVYDQDLVKASGKVYTSPIQKTNLSKTEAYEYAKTELAKILREKEMSYDVTVLGSYKYKVGEWLEFINPTTKSTEVMFISSCGYSISPSKNLRCNLNLTYGPKPIEETSGGAVATGDLSSLDGIMKQAAKFKYERGTGLNTAAQLEKYGKGDCWAMSEWLYLKLTAAGIKAKVVTYGTTASANHRSVLYYDGGWKDVPYRQYGISKMFRNTSGSASGRQILP